MALCLTTVKTSIRGFRQITAFRDIFCRCYCATSSTVRFSLEQNVGSSPADVSVKGWIQSLRSHKDITFIDIRDGSCLQTLQVILPSNVISSDLTYGSSVEVRGQLLQSSHKGQSVEMHATDINMIGTCDSEVYPIKVKTRHSFEYLRQYPHLRCRTNAFGSLLRVRNAATMLIHSYFQDNSFIHINTPIITSNDCEGAGELFKIEPEKQVDESSESEECKHFFDVPVYLTVSGQLQLEAMASGLSKVYTFGPTFRAENSQTRKHLAEFYMVEAEVAFTQSLEDIMQIMEGCVKCVTNRIIEQCPHEVELFHKHVAASNHKDLLKKILDKTYKRITYSDAINILQKKKGFEFPTQWGCDLQSEHEKYLVKYFNNVPVFVTDYPACLKPFYARDNQDSPNTVAAVDLLMPVIGELFGGSLREERLDVLQNNLTTQGQASEYEWYLDLRKHGSVPHGGFGMGFERFLQCILGIDNIKDTIPFPRFPHSCLL